MAMVLFRASPLPEPPSQYDPQYIRQFIRILELYFSQWDSLTPNHASSYTATQFIGGIFTTENVTTAEKNVLDVGAGAIVFDTNLGKLCVYNGASWETITSV